ncbi:hypothetical protein N9C86_02760 [Schleiferiaceae bacterium]|nr:hypothetical protein [Schleiferiaceae bacterium]MDC1226003.1 hypothetical protein [Schleiferiaceae bacterium]
MKKMKGFLTILTLVISLSASATHWLTYYVYYETEYIQGPWTRTDILERSKYKYLASEAFEDLFGSEDADLVNKILSRLKEKKPNTYNWTYELTFQDDTVILTPKGQIKELETVKNEITATLTFNNFKAVTFRFADNQETLTIEDLTIPYFDLVSGQQQKIEPAEEQETIKDIVDTQKHDYIQTNKTLDKEGDWLTIWLIISGILNIGLIGMLLMKKKN